LWPQRDAKEKKEKKNEKKSTGVFFPLILRETQKEKKRNGREGDSHTVNEVRQQQNTKDTHSVIIIFTNRER